MPDPQDLYVKHENDLAEHLKVDYGKHGQAFLETAGEIGKKYNMSKMKDDKEIFNCLVDSVISYRQKLHLLPDNLTPEMREEVEHKILAEMGRRGYTMARWRDMFRNNRGDEAIKEVTQIYKREWMSNKAQVWYDRNIHSKGQDYITQVAEGMKKHHNMDRNLADIVKELPEQMHKKVEARLSPD